MMGCGIQLDLGRGALSAGARSGETWRPPGDLGAHPAFCCASVSQSEDKIKAVANLYGPLMALTHVVQQDYFPKAHAPLLLAFMTK